MTKEEFLIFYQKKLKHINHILKQIVKIGL